MEFPIYCLMLSGRGLSEELCEALRRTANAMLGNDRRRRRFSCGEAEGVVTTKFQAASIGSLVGVVFEATYDRGKATNNKVSFLVRQAPPEADEWGAWQTGTVTELLEQLAPEQATHN